MGKSCALLPVALVVGVTAIAGCSGDDQGGGSQNTSELTGTWDYNGAYDCSAAGNGAVGTMTLVQNGVSFSGTSTGTWVGSVSGSASGGSVSITISTTCNKTWTASCTAVGGTMSCTATGKSCPDDWPCTADFTMTKR